MNTNPYTPPNANLENVPKSDEVPALWNPVAAAMWSVLWSPIFGAFVQMKNWQVLGELEKAAQSKLWGIAGICFFLVLAIAAVFLPESKGIDLAFRFAGFGFLIAWFTLSSRLQINYVKERFGGKYPRRGWGQPLLYAVLISAFAVFILIVAVLTLF
jgi:hypothetical protein